MTRPRTSSRRHAPSGVLDGPVVAVELWPSLRVQAAWWAEPALRSSSVVIAAPSGQIVAASVEALACGVTPGHTTTQARLGCPSVQTRSPDLFVMHELWRCVLTALLTVSPTVEDSGDADGLAYLDVRGLERLWGDDAAVAQRAIQAVAGAGLYARAGVGPTRVIARALARRMGEDGPRALQGDDAVRFLHQLPLDDPAFALDPHLLDDLSALGIRRAGDLAALSRDAVALRLGARAVVAWQRASAAPEPPLTAWSPPMHITRDHTIDGGASDDRLLVERLVTVLCEAAGTQLVTQGKAVCQLVLALLCESDRPLMRTLHLSPAAQTTAQVIAAGQELWRMMQPPAAVERVRLTATGLVPALPVQPGLFTETAPPALAEQQARLRRVLTAYTAEFGDDQVRRIRRHPRRPGCWLIEDHAP